MLFKVVSCDKMAIVRRFDCAGRSFINYLINKHTENRQRPRRLTENEETAVDDDDVYRVDLEYLMSLDPKEWKVNLLFKERHLLFVAYICIQ